MTYIYIAQRVCVLGQSAFQAEISPTSWRFVEEHKYAA